MVGLSSSLTSTECTEDSADTLGSIKLVGLVGRLEEGPGSVSWGRTKLEWVSDALIEDCKDKLDIEDMGESKIGDPSRDCMVYNNTGSNLAT